MRYINKARYLAVDKASDIPSTSYPRCIRVSYVYMWPPGCRPEQNLHGIIVMKILRNMNIGDNFYFSFNSERTFNKVGCNSECQ